MDSLESIDAALAWPPPRPIHRPATTELSLWRDKHMQVPAPTVETCAEDCSESPRGWGRPSKTAQVGRPSAVNMSRKSSRLASKQSKSPHGREQRVDSQKVQRQLNFCAQLPTRAKHSLCRKKPAKSQCLTLHVRSQRCSNSRVNVLPCSCVHLFRRWALHLFLCHPTGDSRNWVAFTPPKKKTNNPLASSEACFYH